MALTGTPRGPDLKKSVENWLATLPPKVEQQAAFVLARLFTKLAREDFRAGRTVYGDPRPPGVAGDRLDLVRSGLVRGSIGFVPNGNRVRSTVEGRYAKYLIGRYKILPNGRGPLPERWQREAEKYLKVFLTDSKKRRAR